MSKNKQILIDSFLWGILAHGMTLFNKYSFHDDAGLFEIGGTYSLGRWMLGLLGELGNWLFGSDYYSVPLFNGLLTILFIAVSAMFLTDLFSIKNKWLVCAVSGLMVVFPAVTSSFGYMFTAPYYFLGELIGVFGCWLSCNSVKWWKYLLGLFLTGCAVGVYQAFIPVFISIILIYAISQTAAKQTEDWRHFFRMAFKSILSCAGFMAFYFVCNKIALTLTETRLSDYQGINNWGATSLRGYFDRILFAYREFFFPNKETGGNMYPFSTVRVYQILMVLTGIAVLYLLYQSFKKSIGLGLQLLVFTAFFPLAVNFIYFMCDPGQVDSMMNYGEVLFFIFLAWLLDSGLLPDERIGSFPLTVRRLAARLSFFFLILLNVMFCRFDNICYLKAEYLQQQAISYYTALIAQIKSTEGYTVDTPIVYINEFEKYDSTLTSTAQFKEIQLIPYNHSRIINDYAWRITMRMWCNFDPVVEDSSEYAELPEVLEMPSYPNDGSIRMLDGVLIVKF